MTELSSYSAKLVAIGGELYLVLSSNQSGGITGVSKLVLLPKVVHRLKTNRIINGCQPRVAVIVQLLDAVVAGRGNRTQREPTADPLSPMRWMHRRIEEKRMRTAVPCDIRNGHTCARTVMHPT